MNFNTNNEMNFQSFNNTKRPNNGMNNATTIQNTSMNPTINDKNVSNVCKNNIVAVNLFFQMCKYRIYSYQYLFHHQSTYFLVNQ